MENTKKGNGLVITLIIIVVALATCATLLFTGVVKSPFIDEKKCTCIDDCDDETVDYKELEEDKTSIMESGYVTNAKLKDDSSGTAIREYKGKGYTVKEYQGGEIKTYKIFIGDKLEWEYSKHYPLTTN